MTEAELCLHLESYLSDWEIYKEVPTYNGGRLDMYVKKGPIWVAVEVKMQFSTGLIFQAMRSRYHANYTYVAVPDLKSSYGSDICNELGIGVLVLRKHFTGRLEWREQVKPRFYRKITPYRVLDVMKHSVAGVQHNDQSEFKITVAQIKMEIYRRGGRVSIKELFQNNRYHYSHSSSAKQCITRLCKSGLINGLKIDGKDIILSEN